MLLFRIIHILICVFSAYGILFSKTPLQAYIVLCYLVIIFLGLRLFKGCVLSPLEKDATSDIGRVFILEKPESVSVHNFEEITVGFSVLLQIIRTALIMFNLQDIFF